MDKLQKVLNEVERLQNELITEKKKGYGSDVDDACILELQNIKNYIKFVQEEPVSEGLEEAIGEYCSNPDNFATWIGGKENDDIPLIIKAIKFGAQWKEQQMIKDAIDVEVKVDAGGYPYIDRTIELYDYDKDVPLAKAGDKVKVKIIKED